MDTLGIEPRACRMRSGCDTTTACARLRGYLAVAVRVSDDVTPAFVTTPWGADFAAPHANAANHRSTQIIVAGI